MVKNEVKEIKKIVTEEIFEDNSRMERKKEYNKRETRGWIISLTTAIVVALLLRFFVFEFIRVEGSSMLPSLHTNEYVFTEKVSYRFSEPKRGDIIICSFPNMTETFVKRVIGIEGDVLEVKDGTLFINGQKNDDTRTFEETMKHDLAPITVPENTVFVMGDNRNHSHDSTDNSVGALSYDMIIGRAVFVLWPLDMIHVLS